MGGFILQSRTDASALYCHGMRLLCMLFASAFIPNVGMAKEQARGWDRTAETPQFKFEPLVYDKSYALLIGASHYETWPELSHVASELDDVQQTLETQDFKVRRLTDPNSEDLRRGIEQFIDDYGYDEENRLLIFFSGHGHSVKDKGFLVPVDAPSDEDAKGFRRKALPMTQVLAWARDIEAKHVLFLFDSCFSGTIFSSRAMSTIRDSNIRKAMSFPVRQFITAGGEKDEVPAKSTFTPMFVNAILGEGDLNADGYVTGSELGLHLSQQVPKYTRQIPQYGKIHDYALSKGDFVFAVPTDKSAQAFNAQKAITKQTEPTPDSTKAAERLALELDLELWRTAREFGNKSDYEAYLKEFPNGKFASMARNKISTMSKKVRVASNNKTIRTPDVVQVVTRKPIRNRLKSVVKSAQGLATHPRSIKPVDLIEAENVFIPKLNAPILEMNKFQALAADDADWVPIRSTAKRANSFNELAGDDLNWQPIDSMRDTQSR